MNIPNILYDIYLGDLIEESVAKYTKTIRRNAKSNRQQLPSTFITNASASCETSISSPSPPPRPFTPIDKGDHEDFHDHPIPLNQMAQKIPSLLDLVIQPSPSGNQYICLI